MSDTLAWWLVLEVIGVIGLPIALVAFRRLPDAGYAFAKPLTLLLGGYIFWLSLTIHVLPNRAGSVAWAFIIIAAISGLIFYPRRKEMLAILKERWTVILAVEAVFTVVFFAGAYLRSFIPEIGGTEKPMDFMFLNAASRSRYYPPDDAWFAGAGVSYYYFGYVLQAMLAKLAGIQTAIAFNLAIASTAALAASAAFGLGYNLVRILRGITLRAGVVTGVVAVVLLLVIGNLEVIFEYGAANGLLSQGFLRSLGIASITEARESSSCLIPFIGDCLAYPTDQSSNWWWWRATRIHPTANSITEFPFFSFLLGDLHPHVMALPFVLTGVALGIALWRSATRLDIWFWNLRPAMLLLLAVFIGSFGFLNTWDLPTFAFVIGLLVLARNFILARDPEQPMRDRVQKTVLDSAGFLLPLAAVAVVAYLPFYLSFSSQASGIEAVGDGATRPLHSLLFWGPLVLVALPLPLVLLTQHRAILTRNNILAALALPLLLFAAWCAHIAYHDGFSALDSALAARGWNGLTVVFFALALGACLLALWQALTAPSEDDDKNHVPALIAMSVAFLLILGSELFYVQDVFRSRLNTVFKLYYQAWLLLAISGAYSLFVLYQRWQPREALTPFRAVWAGLVAVVLLAALLYPLGATLARTEGLARPNRTLDGLAFARRESQEDYAGLSWLMSSAEDGDVIAEAMGGQYSGFARISSRSGVPAVLGWAGHEIQWGRDGLEIAKREQDIDLAYTTPSLPEAVAILRRYRVTYVFVGSLERSKYPAAGLEKFAGLSDAFRAGDTVVYRMPLNDAPLQGGGR